MNRARESRCCSTRSKRPRSCRAAEQRDELTPVHSITSSARASRVGGRSRSRVFNDRGLGSRYIAGAPLPALMPTRAPCRSVIRAIGQRATGLLAGVTIPLVQGFEQGHALRNASTTSFMNSSCIRCGRTSI
jgi:hypothetical protein